jgi:hypothetical protein
MAPYPSTADATESPQSCRPTYYKAGHQAVSFAVAYTLLRPVYRALPELSTRSWEVPLKRYLVRLGRFERSKTRRRAMCPSGTTIRSGGIAATD